METAAADSFNDDLPDPEVCSCEEALALREEVARLRGVVDANNAKWARLADDARDQLRLEARARGEAWDRVEWLTRRVADLEDLGYAGALKLAAAEAEGAALQSVCYAACRQLDAAQGHRTWEERFRHCLVGETPAPEPKP